MSTIKINQLPSDILLIIYNQLNLYSKYKFTVALKSSDFSLEYDLYILIQNNSFKSNEYIRTFDSNFIKLIFKFFYQYKNNNLKNLISKYENIFIINFINHYIFYKNDFLNILSDFINRNYLDYLYNKYRNDNNETLGLYHLYLYKIFLKKNKNNNKIRNDFNFIHNIYIN